MHLAPHVLAAVRQAHDAAVRDLDGARRELARVEEKRDQESRRVASYAAREAELRAALDHQAATFTPDPPAPARREPLHLDAPRTDRDDRRR